MPSPQHAIAFQDRTPDLGAARALPIAFNFTTQASYTQTEDLATVGLNMLRSIFFDNSNSPAPTILQFTGPSNQKIVMAPFSQGYLSIIGSPQSLDYTITNQGGGAPFTAGAPLLVPIYFLNTIVDSDLTWNIQPANAQNGTPLAQSSQGAATTLTATFAAVPGRRTYVSTIEVTASGSTAALPVNVTLSGVDNAGTPTTLNYVFVFPAGVGVPAQPLIVSFNPPIPITLGQAAVLTLPSGGAGNTNAAVAMDGFYV